MTILKNLFAGYLILFLASCQSPDNGHRSDKAPPGNALLTPGEFLDLEGMPRPNVTLVGTFHFNYPGLDVHKTEESDKIDVLQPNRQKEMGELLDHLSRFRPNKIVIESTLPEKWNDMYRDYLNGDLEPMRDERVQLGFALGKRFELDTMYCLDAGSFVNDYEWQCEALDTIFEHYDWKSDDPIEARLAEYLDYREKSMKDHSLYDIINLMNSDASWQFNYGFYLIGDFKLDNFAGADALALYWYNRNLRIFRKIQMITESPEDRILVIFGNGHVAILDQLFRCTPEYTYTPFQDL